MINKEKPPLLSLIIPCYNEQDTLRSCVERCLELEKHGILLELVIVNDCSTDKSAKIARDMELRHSCVKLVELPRNMGKGAALRKGFEFAHGQYVGIQDADSEYDPLDYLRLLQPLLEGRADVVYGSRYLRRDERRVLYFWHTWMNRSLTFVSNMFTNLDIGDMETCYKLFSREAINKIWPLLQENRFGFEPEVTALVARLKFRVYECAIHYTPRTYEEGKKIGWHDGIHALWCILHYGAPWAPLPMQILLYFLIGLICAVVDVAAFTLFLAFDCPFSPSLILAFILAVSLNYFLCISILFRSRSRWSRSREILFYTLGASGMCLLDWLFTTAFSYSGMNPVLAKAISASLGFLGNFFLRKYLVF